MSGSPGPGRSDQREVRVKRALANPVFFAQAYFAPYDPNWDDVLPRFGQDMLRFVVALRPWPHQAGVIMLPPEFLKTTLISQVFPLWMTVRARVFEELLRGLLFSEEEQMAKGNLGVLRWHIENNERLASDFTDAQGRPLLQPDPAVDIWRDDAIVVHRPGIVSRDPTWQAKGLDSKGIQGRRLDLAIGDDVVTPRNATSPALRKRALETMDLSIETRIVAGGKLIVAGNFNDPKDLLSELERRPRWQVFKRPSLHLPGKPSVAPKESGLREAALTWPENWTRERLLIEYKDKPNRFRRIHLLDPRAEHGERLNVGWVTRVSEEIGAPLLRYARMFIGVDAAPGGEDDDLDFFNITVGALTNSHLDIVQSLDVRAPVGRQIELLATIHNAYAAVGSGVIAIGGAKIAMDRYFSGAVAAARPALAHKLVPISVPGDKETRLEALGAYAQSGWLRIWDPVWERLTSDDADQFQELSFYEQWRDFPYANHDDKLDGCDITIRTASEFAMIGDVEWTMAVAEAS